MKPEHDAGRRVSEGVFARRQVFRDTRERVELALREAGLDEKLVSTINESVLIHSFGSLDPEAQEAEPLSDRDTWRAVIHMDANGLGRIFRHFGALCKDAKLAEPDGALRAFSSAVNHAAWRAVGRAIEDLIEKTAKLRDDQRPKREVYPLVVGGDDITLVTDGRWGLFLARRLLYHWTNAVAELVRGTSDAGSVVRAVLRAAQQKWAADRLPADHLPACAGVALVKHHFPFSQAYALADDLCREAKQAVRKTSDSALDWHAVFDASPPSLDEIRRRLRAHGLASPVHLTRRPYKVQDFDRLTGAVDLLRKKGDDGRRVLPTSQIQSLRAGLFLGQAEAERRLPLARTRVERPLDELLSALHGEPSLFVGDSTGLLDLIDHDELLEGFSGGAP